MAGSPAQNPVGKHHNHLNPSFTHCPPPHPSHHIPTEHSLQATKTLHNPLGSLSRGWDLSGIHLWAENKIPAHSSNPSHAEGTPRRDSIVSNPSCRLESDPGPFCWANSVLGLGFHLLFSSSKTNCNYNFWSKYMNGGCSPKVVIKSFPVRMKRQKKDKQ